MVSNIKRLLFTLSIIAASLSALAVPAKPGLIPMTQPDGSVIEVRLYGDEYHHFYTTADGYYLVCDDSGAFCYADVDAAGRTVSSGIPATAVSARSAEARAYLAGVDMERVRTTMQHTAASRLSHMARTSCIASPAFAPAPQRAAGGPGLFPGTHFPATGKQKGLVILVEYSDVKMTLENPLDYFTRMLNEPGFSDWGGTGSAVDFFRESSMGQFDPEFDVYGPVTLSRARSYYGGNDWGGDDQNPAQMVVEACELLDDVIDFAQYDRDGDGVVDNVFVFYAGRGEASGGPAESVWPHAWNVEYGVGYRPQFDGVAVSRYACSNEYESGRPDGVGTFIHEFSHVMGLPDLYATKYTSSFTPGSWSCMDYGPYNNNGCTPPLYGAFERYALGWMEPIEVSEPADATLPAISTNKAGIIKTPKSNEFFLIENRQQTSWDTYIPGHGMLVWHIDYNSSVWQKNVVNNTPSHQYVDIEEADGSQSDYSRSGDSFPGTAGVTSFTDSGTPNMQTWSGVSLGKPLTEIAESTDGLITFKICGGRTEPLPVPVAAAATDVTYHSFTARWDAVPGALGYLVSVFTISDTNTPLYVPGFKGLENGNQTSVSVDGLEPETTYYYTVTLTTGWEESEPSEPVAITTEPCPLAIIRPEALPATGVTQTGAVASWVRLEAADDYILSLSTVTLTGELHDVCDFTDGTDHLPEGWTSSSGASYANTAYSGNAIPALRLGSGGESVTSATYPEGVRSVTFWHRGNNTGPDDRLALYVRQSGAWSRIADIEIENAQGGKSTTIPLEPYGQPDKVRIEFRRVGDRGAVAIDDITVGYGHTYAYTPVSGLESIHTGDTDTYTLSDLNPGTEYAYSITATDGTALSLPSAQIHFTTTGSSSALGHLTAGSGVTLSAVGLQLTVSGVTPGTVVTIHDIAGRTVAAPVADAAGRASATMPARGVYIAARRKIVL